MKKFLVQSCGVLGVAGLVGVIVSLAGCHGPCPCGAADLTRGVPSADARRLCNLTSRQFDSRGTELRSLMKRAEEVTELSDGYTFRFRGDDRSVAEILRIVRVERRCCDSLRFEVILGPTGGPVVLAVRGDAHAKELLRDVLGISKES